jgi:hypothetical protein
MAENILPEDEGLYKVVQGYLDEIPFLLFGQGGGHALILEKFLLKKDLDFQRRPDNTPKKEGREYRVCGMGEVTILSYGLRKKANFTGESFGYELKIDPEHLEKILGSISDFEFSMG